VAGGPDVVITKTSATNGSMFFLLWGRDFGWLGVWGLNPEWFRHVGIKHLQPGGAGK